MSDYKKSLKEIEEAMRKLHIPTISFDGSAFKKAVGASMKRDENTLNLEQVTDSFWNDKTKKDYVQLLGKVYKLEALTGKSIAGLVEMCAAGWTLQPPKYVMGFDTGKLMESMRKEIEDEIRRAGYLDSRKFDVELLKHQLETMDEMKCYGVDLEEIGSGAPDKIRPVWNLKIDFDSKPEEE